MEISFEIIFEIIFEGTIELARSKKVPMPIRILAAILVLGVLLGLEALFIIIAINAWKNSNTAGCIVMSLFAIAWLILIVCKTAKEYKKHKV